MDRRTFIKYLKASAAFLSFDFKNRWEDKNVYYANGIVIGQHVEGYDRIVMGERAQLLYCTIVKPENSPYEFFIHDADNSQSFIKLHEKQRHVFNYCRFKNEGDVVKSSGLGFGMTA